MNQEIKGHVFVTLKPDDFGWIKCDRCGAKKQVSDHFFYMTNGRHITAINYSCDEVICAQVISD